ncbi:MAG: 5-oxoprolinase subunit PxpA [Thermodesulfobacteriota bacterium]|nr:5-oxoprolinase subunit PxpA [Thermodesulfobacteriota bacterium]
MKKIDLNCDMGESFGPYKMGMDKEAMPHITSANIACAWHAGDPVVMNKTVKMAVENNVNIGAHPGYPDLMGFGRRDMELSCEELRTCIIYQIGALQAFCTAHGTRITHVKPHGSLYLKAVEDIDTACTIARAIVDVDPTIAYIALAGEKGKIMGDIGKEVGLNVIYEAFPDRAYTREGTLAPRKLPNAVIKDPGEVAERALMMATKGKVISIDGKEISLKAQTLCVHGDTPNAVKLLKTIKQTLESNSIKVAPAIKINSKE